MIKKWIRGGIFLCLVLLLLNNLNRVLCVKSPHGVDQTRYLYVQPKNKIDVLFLGSSHVHCNVNTQLLWDEYGMAAYLMTGAEQPLWNSYYNLKEALKNQKPKLVVLDMFCPSRFYDDFQPGWADENLDGMRISLNKLEAVYTSVQEEQSHFFLGFTEYHSRYDQLTTEDFQNFVWNRKTQERWKGYTPLNRHAELTEPDMSHVTTSQEMTEKSKEYFEKVVELTKKEGITLALISGPYLLEERDQEVYNFIGQLAEKDGLLFWNTNTPAHYREMGLDFSTDYADHAHLNEAGGAKYTAYLGKWLSQNYSFPDRRGQKGYESWENQLMTSGE